MGTEGKYDKQIDDFQKKGHEGVILMAESIEFC